MHSLQIKTGEVWVSDYFWKFWLFWEPDCQVVSHHCTGDQPNKSMIWSFLGSALASIESQRQSLLSVRLPNWLPPGRQATILLQVCYREQLSCCNVFYSKVSTSKLPLASTCLLPRMLARGPVINMHTVLLHTTCFCNGIVWRGPVIDMACAVHSVDCSCTRFCMCTMLMSRTYKLLYAHSEGIQKQQGWMVCLTSILF